MTDDDRGGNLYENHSKLCLIYNQKSRCVEKKSLDISHTQTRTRIYDLIEKSHQSDKNISESLSDTIECKYITISTCFLYSGLYTQVSESINCYLNYTWKMLLANRLRRFGIFLQSYIPCLTCLFAVRIIMC